MPATNSISPLIDNIIQERGKQVPVIEQQIENINQIYAATQELRDALDYLLQHPQVTEELKSRLQEFGSVSSSWTEEITSAIARLENAKNRFARQAVTIGCSGQARVGKSTLLQTIGNLPEEAIPTGKGIPVTAVRSRLRHSSESKAILSLRDKKTFLDELIKPFHRELNLPVVNSFEDFRNFDYNSNLATDKTVPLVDRLKKMQAALTSYEKHLTGQTKTIEDLTQLRPWVAYPKQKEENSPNCSRLYLAVKDVEIQCSFLLDVEKLMLIDLPGLGEVNVDAEEHHVQGLRNEVDLVLLMLQPGKESSFWRDPDQNALNLISKAVEGVSKLGDFLIIVVNHRDDDDPDLYKILINDVHQKLNENQPNSRYQLLTCNAKDPKSVREKALVPVLNHLINRLPVMDKEIIDSSITQWQATLEKISIAINKLAISLQKFPTQGSRDDRVFQKAKELRAKLAVELGEEILELRKEVQSEKNEGSIIDQDLIEAIEEKHQHIQTWVENGLGEGKEEWYKKAKGKFAEYKDVKPFATEEINRARTYVTETYSQLDIYFDSTIEELWRKISQRILACTGSLLEETPNGQEMLEKFLRFLEGRGIGDPFPSLREATDYLLKCGTENAIFQSHLLPRLVEQTEKLEPESLNFSGLSYQDEQAPEKVLKIVSLRIIQTSFEVQKTLRFSPFISNILYSAAVKFEDSLVRSKDVDEQFFNFASLYKNEIWASEFQSIQNNHAMVKRTEEAITNLKQTLSNSLQG